MAASNFFGEMSISGPMTAKRVFTIGATGGVMVGASDYWVDRWWANETDAKKKQRYRAMAQVALGLAAGYVIKSWSRDIAVGVALGGIMGGGRRLWISEEMPSRMSRWFSSSTTNNTNNTTNNTTQQNALGAGSPDGRVMFSSPVSRSRVNN